VERSVISTSPPPAKLKTPTKKFVRGKLRGAFRSGTLCAILATKIKKNAEDGRKNDAARS